jgi:DNA helicase HerA-like ATPase
MTEDERRALAALRLDWALTPDDVWSPPPFHMSDLHRDAADLVVDGIRKSAEGSGSSPLGVVVAGDGGTGKTHLLSWVRQQVQRAGGYFFLVGLMGTNQWETTALAIVHDLGRMTDAGAQQSRRLASGLSSYAGLSGALHAEIAGDAPLSKTALDTFIAALRKSDRQVGLDGQDVARAVVLIASTDQDAQNVGHEYLTSRDESEPGERATWGIRQVVRSPQHVVRDLSRLLALSGPSVVAVDQIDTLFAQDESRNELRAAQVGDVLMSLREITRRTLTVVACLPRSWELIRTRAAATVPHRFRQPLVLKGIPDPEMARELIRRRLAARFGEIAFTPPHDTWPVGPAAFETARDSTPRQLLMELEAHVERCLRLGEVSELGRFGAAHEDVAPVPEPATDLGLLDARFAGLKGGVDVTSAVSPENEDRCMPPLLAAGLAALTLELGEGGRSCKVDPPPGPRPALHARLRRVLDPDTDDEVHWAFRAIAAEHHVAALSRIRNACAMAGVEPGAPKRRLFLLRNIAWSPGGVTQAVLRSLRESGGDYVPVTAGDLATFAALRAMLKEAHPDLLRWLAVRRPAGRTELFSKTLADAAGGFTDGRSGREPEPSGGPPRVRVGTAIEGGGAIVTDLESLRKHVALFAGSGSGKTVLVRRLVEECALLGVSAIVLDPNNDLARLGDAWPAVPAGWGAGDAERAMEYLAHVEVVIWTPGRESGRPLSFRPLPDFRGVMDDPDELAAAIEVAASALAARANLVGRSDRVELSRAVLKEALEFFARQGGGDLRAFIELLKDLPDGVSEIRDARKFGDQVAQKLIAARKNDPLFAGAGEPVDPGLLLTPRTGKRARVSVISFIGLSDEDRQQGFVNQLQMALFAWIKKHPAGDRPLGGLFVMDEAQMFARSGAMTACTMSTIMLASQARKYGLGLVFATQAPKGLNNQISGNATTQFYGRLNSSAQINTARELARAKGIAHLEVAGLGRGEFYLTGEDIAFRKIQAPMCLTHHPRGPLTAEEVLRRARKTE